MGKNRFTAAQKIGQAVQSQMVSEKLDGRVVEIAEGVNCPGQVIAIRYLSKGSFTCPKEQIMHNEHYLALQAPRLECVTENYFSYFSTNMLWVLKRTISMKRFF